VRVGNPKNLEIRTHVTVWYANVFVLLVHCTMSAAVCNVRLCTLTAVPRSTQPSTLRGTVKWVSACELSNNNKWWWCLQMVAANLSADSQPKSVGLVWGLAATQRSVCIHQMNRVNSHITDYVMMTAPLSWSLLLSLLRYLLCFLGKTSNKSCTGVLLWQWNIVCHMHSSACDKLDFDLKVSTGGRGMSVWVSKSAGSVGC